MNHERILATWLFRLLEMARYWSNNQFFVRFGELPTDGYQPISENLLEVGERGTDPVRSFEEDDGPFLSG